MKKCRKNFIHLSIAVIFGILFYSCKEKDGASETTADAPAGPVLFNDFAPKKGAVRTRLYIEGSNFGNDVNKIKVFIGEQELKVVGSNGKQIYCMIPRYTSSGKVKVVITFSPMNSSMPKVPP